MYKGRGIGKYIIEARKKERMDDINDDEYCEY